MIIDTSNNSTQTIVVILILDYSEFGWDFTRYRKWIYITDLKKIGYANQHGIQDTTSCT